MNTVKDLQEALAAEVRRLQPPPGLESRILHHSMNDTAAVPSRNASGHRDNGSRESRGRGPFSAGVRGLGALAAVLLIVLIVVGILVGGRTLRGWGVHNQSPAHSSRQAELAQLEARPVNLPTLQPADACPNQLGSNGLSYDFGSGPVYEDTSVETVTSWGTYWDGAYYTAQNLTGLVIVRGRDLRSPSRQMVFVGRYSAGRTLGSDTAPGTGVQHSELVLDAGHPPFRDSNGSGVWNTRQGMPNGFAGCFGIQIDGRGFTETIIGDRNFLFSQP